MTKKYFCGYRNATYGLPSGKSAVFTERCTGDMGSILITSNTKMMKEIENLFDFKSGIIRILQVIVDQPKAEKADKRLSFHEVKNVQQAICTIKSECEKRGTPYKTIRSREAAMQEAERMGIVFPNLK